jgi:Holliday junction DNA helicase RuvB
LSFVGKSKAAVGVEAIASALSEQRQMVEEAIEPFLVQLGFVSRTRKGRVITEIGLQHLQRAV